MEKITFDKLNLSKTTFDAITKKGFTEPSEIQAKVIPLVFEEKHDVIGIAQTGTGKTGAFGLPLVDLIDERNKLPQAIIMAPTRELALQVTRELEMFCGKKRLNILTVYGGSPINAQIKSLKRGVDIVVGTPGRVVDLIKRRQLILEESRYFILDEADEMLKMGFIEDIEFVLEASSKKRRVYLFSATMPSRIKQLSKKYMKKQIIVEVEKKQEVSKLIEQTFYKTRQVDKYPTLTTLIDMSDFFYGIVFCRTKADVDNITSSLKKEGHRADCIHGDILQSKRERILKKFKDNKIDILVATDVAARGIDVESLTHVINYNLPEDVETYTHRIGRTGRAGKMGKAISLVTAGEMRRISNIERTLKCKVQSMKLPSDKDVKKKMDAKNFATLDEMINSNDVNKNLKLANELLSKHDAINIISALLGRINPQSTSAISGAGMKSNGRSDRNEKRSGSRKFDGGKRRTFGNETRIFIAKGKMDKMNNKSLIRFIEKETRVRIGKVKDIKVCDKFSFITMDEDTAHEVVDAFESKGRRRPLAEIAQR